MPKGEFSKFYEIIRGGTYAMLVELRKNRRCVAKFVFEVSFLSGINAILK